MPDVYNTITSAQPALVQRIAQALEVRGADLQQKSMLGSYLAEIKFPANARVIEIGCGTGPVSRRLAGWPYVGEVIGIDPSPIFLDKARELVDNLTNLTFREGDAHQLPATDEDFDVAVFHTTLCHLSDPKGALQEAHRVLKPGGESLSVPLRWDGSCDAGRRCRTRSRSMNPRREARERWRPCTGRPRCSARRAVELPYRC